jgi:hypothetical protein
MKLTDLKLNYIYLLSGILFIVYMFYIRVIMVRLPKDLHLYVNEALNTKLLVVVFIGVILSLYIILINFYRLLYKEIKQGIISKLALTLSDFLDKALHEVFRFGEIFFSDGYEVLSQLANKFYSIFGTITEELFIFIAYGVRIFLVIIFLIDVFYFFKLEYFYKAVIFLCIPILINMLIYILTNFAKNLEEIKSTLTIEDLGVDEKDGLPIKRYGKSPGNEDIDLAYHIQHYILCNKVNGYLEEYKVLLDYYSIRLNIVIYSLYLTGWLYILFQNFFRFF